MCFSRGEDKIEWASKHEAKPAGKQATNTTSTYSIVLSWKHIFESNYKQLAFMQLLHLRPRQVDILSCRILVPFLSRPARSSIRSTVKYTRSLLETTQRVWHKTGTSMASHGVLGSRDKVKRGWRVKLERVKGWNRPAVFHHWINGKTWKKLAFWIQARSRKQRGQVLLVK